MWCVGMRRRDEVDGSRSRIALHVAVSSGDIGVKAKSCLGFSMVVKCFGYDVINRGGFYKTRLYAGYLKQ